jgi:hypothetical protein
MGVGGAVGLTAVLSAPTGAGAVLVGVGLALLAVPRPSAVAAALVALGVAAAVAIDQGAGPTAAPLWGSGLLVAGALAERVAMLPGDGVIEADALVAWLAALGVLAGVGLAAGALVLLAARTDAGTSAIGLAGGALLAVVPVLLARRQRGRDAG